MADRRAGDCGCEAEKEKVDGSASRLQDDAYRTMRQAGADGKGSFSAEGGQSYENPVDHLRMARELEKAGNIGGATIEFKAAVAAADRLPFESFKENLTKTREEMAKSEQARRDLEYVERGLVDLIAMPFDARVELARFYGRTGRFPEAQEAVDDAIKLGLDPSAKDRLGKSGREVKADELRDSLVEFAGRPALAGEFPNYSDKLDTDRNKHVDMLELRRAQLDTSIDARGQELVNFMMRFYPDLLRVSDDEPGPETKGITKADMKKYRENFERALKENRRER